MQSLRRLLSPARAYILTVSIVIGSSRGAHALTEMLTMDVLPETQGWELLTYPGDEGSSTISGGILTLETPQNRAYRAPSSWIDTVVNFLGWSIEFRMRIVSSDDSSQTGNIGVFINDDAYLTVVCIDKDALRICYPTYVEYPIDTTDGFHTYLLVGQNDQIKIYVDDVLAIDYVQTIVGSGTRALNFGDLTAANTPSVSEWDYFRYTTNAHTGTETSTWGGIKSLFR